MGICDSSNGKNSQNLTSKSYPAQVESVEPVESIVSVKLYPPVELVVPVNSYVPVEPVVPVNSYVPEPVVPVKSYIPVAPVEPAVSVGSVSIGGSIHKSIPIVNSDQIIKENSIHRLKPPVINRVFEPIYPKDIQNPDFNSFNIDYSNILGKGPFGTVYLGINKFSYEKVAVKIELKKQSFFCSYILNEI